MELDAQTCPCANNIHKCDYNSRSQARSGMIMMISARVTTSPHAVKSGARQLLLSQVQPPGTKQS